MPFIKSIILNSSRSIIYSKLYLRFNFHFYRLSDLSKRYSANTKLDTGGQLSLGFTSKLQETPHLVSPTLLIPYAFFG